MSIRIRPRVVRFATELAAALVTVIAAAPVLAAAPSDEARAVPFVEVAKTAAPDRDWQRNLCALVSAKCDADADAKPSLYRIKGDGPADYYAILPGPQLLKLGYAAGWKVLQRWDFSDYAPAERELGDGTAPPLDIYPALYPLGGDRVAVAVLAGWSEMYSGGGGSWQDADFVELLPNGAHASRPRIATLPFSCSKTIRACFSEREYKHAPHCSEDFDGTLRLRFVPGARRGELDWIATWKETHWPGLKPRSATERTSVSVTLPAGQDPVAAGRELRDRVSFCEPLN